MQCIRYHYNEHPDDLKSCKPVPKKTMQQLLGKHVPQDVVMQCIR